MRPTAGQVLKMFDNNVARTAQAAGISRQAVNKWKTNPSRLLDAEVVINLERNTSGLIEFDKEDFFLN